MGFFFFNVVVVVVVVACSTSNPVWTRVSRCVGGDAPPLLSHPLLPEPAAEADDGLRDGRA